MTPEPCLCRLQGWDVFFFFCKTKIYKKKKKTKAPGRRVGDEGGQGEDAPATRPVARAAALLPFAAGSAVCLYLWFDISDQAMSQVRGFFSPSRKLLRKSSRFIIAFQPSILKPISYITYQPARYNHFLALTFALSFPDFPEFEEKEREATERRKSK